MRFVLFLAIILLANLAPAQNILELKNISTGKTRYLTLGSKLYFRLKQDSTFYEGKVVQIKDSLIVMYLPEYDDEMSLMDVPVNNIYEIRKPTDFHALSRTVASVLLPVGSLFFLTGGLPLLRNDNYYDKDRAIIYTAVGGGLFLAGIIPFLIPQKLYKLNKEWTLSVRKLKKK